MATPVKNIFSEEFNQIFKNTAVLLILADSKGRFVNINRAGVEMVGKEKDNILNLQGGEVFNFVNA